MKRNIAIAIVFAARELGYDFDVFTYKTTDAVHCPNMMQFAVAVAWVAHGTVAAHRDKCDYVRENYVSDAERELCNDIGMFAEYFIHAATEFKSEPVGDRVRVY